MQNLPIKVKERLQLLKNEHSHYVGIKIISGHYYAFEITSGWNKDLKKRFTTSIYLGTIKEDGSFVPVRKKGTPEPGLELTQPIDVPKMDGREETIIRNLSMNSRIPIPMLVKRLGLSITATRYQIDKVEKKYGIRYLAEIDAEKLGYLSYITVVKFTDRIPNVEYVKEILESESNAQLVLFTRGIYDLVIFSEATDSRDIARFVYKLISTSFKAYPSKWYTSPYYGAYGYIPLREQFFELLKDRVWKRTKDKPRPKANDIIYRDYVVLKELANKGNINFTDIDAKYGLNAGTSQYTYHKLKENGVLTRITISMTSPYVKYNAIIFESILDGDKFSQTREKFLNDVIQQTNAHVNKYAISGDVEIPKGILFIMPIFNDGDLEKSETLLKDKVKGIELNSLIVTSVAIGKICYRLFDNMYSKHYEALIKEYKEISSKEKEIYE